MTPADFTAWVAHMRTARGLREYDLVKLLGSGANQVTRWKKTGAPPYIGLACAAIIADLPAWQAPKIGRRATREIRHLDYP